MSNIFELQSKIKFITNYEEVIDLVYYKLLHASLDSNIKNLKTVLISPDTCIQEWKTHFEVLIYLVCVYADKGKKNPSKPPAKLKKHIDLLNKTVGYVNVNLSNRPDYALRMETALPYTFLIMNIAGMFNQQPALSTNINLIKLCSNLINVKHHHDRECIVDLIQIYTNSFFENSQINNNYLLDTLCTIIPDKFDATVIETGFPMMLAGLIEKLYFHSLRSPTLCWRSAKLSLTGNILVKLADFISQDAAVSIYEGEFPGFRRLLAIPDLLPSNYIRDAMNKADQKDLEFLKLNTSVNF